MVLYLEKRFSRRMQLFGSVLFVCKAIIWLPLAVYMPALVLNQMSGIDVHALTPVLMIVCTFYTTLGGIKGVIWSDVIQLMITLSAILVLLFKGTFDLGGVGVVLERSFQGGRIRFPELTLDPTVRMSVLSVFWGGTFMKLQNYAINQTFVQRFMSLPTKKEIKKCIILTTGGVISVYCCCYYVGLVTFAYYYDCDPISTGLVKKKDQIIPLLVMQVLGSFPGMTGLFVAGVLSAALSAISTLLNSLSAVILSAFIKPYIKEENSERIVAIAMRLVVVVFGLSSIGLVYVVENLGLVMQLSMTVQSALYGPMLGLFTVGVTMPWINDKSVLCGAILSFASMICICTKASVDNATGAFRYPTLPVTTAGCEYDFQISNSTITHHHHESFSVFRISFLLYTFTGALLTVIFSNMAIFVYGRNRISDVDDILLAPFVVRLKQKYYGYTPKVKNQEPNKQEELEKLTI